MLELLKLKKNHLIYIFLLLYCILHSTFLTDFPFIHSDEPWLSGLSRNMLEHQTFSTTESFFDLYPRNPHAIKIFFHAIQGVVIKVFGYSLFNMRFISLIFSVLVLLTFFNIVQSLYKSIWLSMLSVLMLSLDIQFIYAAHFARQEIVILCVFITALYLNIIHLEKLSKRIVIITGIIIGISIGIHPNSFVIAIPFALLYGYQFLLQGKKIQPIITYTVIISLFAIIFIGISLSFNLNFVSDYPSYGSDLGVTSSLFSKIIQLKPFIMKLFYSISGTYYTPNIQLQFFVFGIATLMSFYICFKERDSTIRHKIIFFYLALLGILSGIIIVGRYNPTSIIFFFPLFYLLLIYDLSKLGINMRLLTIFLICLALFVSSLKGILPYTKADYSAYLSSISKTVPSFSPTLANLNSEYYFNSEDLFDYRNLAFLKDNDMSFSEYINSNQIQYIIYPEEMDYIYHHRPLYNGMYGNLYPYYDEMQQFLKEGCLLMDSFESHYGMRIAKYFLKKKWQVRVYKVLPK